MFKSNRGCTKSFGERISWSWKNVNEWNAVLPNHGYPYKRTCVLLKQTWQEIQNPRKLAIQSSLATEEHSEYVFEGKEIVGKHGLADVYESRGY